MRMMARDEGEQPAIATELLESTKDPEQIRIFDSCSCRDLLHSATAEEGTPCMYMYMYMHVRDRVTCMPWSHLVIRNLPPRSHAAPIHTCTCTSTKSRCIRPSSSSCQRCCRITIFNACGILHAHVYAHVCMYHVHVRCTYLHRLSVTSSFGWQIH